MSSIDRIASGFSVQKPTATPLQKQVPATAPRQLPLTDKLELSGMSHLLKALQQNDIRAEKVAEIKSRIDAGTYEDDRKLEAALDRLLDDLLK